MTPNSEKLKELLDRIRSEAEKSCWPDNDDFFILDYSGENFDDAYNGGLNAGKTLFARDLLSLLQN